MARVPRSRRHSFVASPVQLPITPMLDVTFQLLAFFVLTFHPQTAMEGSMALNLPGQGQLTSLAPVPPEFREPKADEPTRLTIHVRAVQDGLHDGSISALIVQTTAGDLAVRDLDALRQKLERQPDSGKAEVRIVADAHLKYGCIVDVMDACLQSGIRRVGFGAPPDLGAP